MNPATIQFPLRLISLAILSALTVSPTVLAQQTEDEIIEEVVATGTRLKGTATAVLEERKTKHSLPIFLVQNKYPERGMATRHPL